MVGMKRVWKDVVHSKLLQLKHSSYSSAVLFNSDIVCFVDELYAKRTDF